MEYIELKEQIKEKLTTPQEFDGNRNLLELGLSSLKIMRMVNQWRKQGIRVSFGELMEEPTLDSWWKIIQKSGKKDIHKAVAKETGKKRFVETNKPFPLTDVQYAYKIGRADGEELGGVGCHAYLEFDGEGVSAEKLKKAWNAV
ncbi:MAG: non-ribosomal peptide synthetase, partial [Eubacterium sp.]|nr:non-ribosomal peptide synthetase [Eubacterium sp.]